MRRGCWFVCNIYFFIYCRNTAKNSLLALYDENRQLRQELGREVNNDPIVLGVQIRDLPDSEGGVNKMADNAELKQRLEEERKLRQEAEKELDLQVIYS